MFALGAVMQVSEKLRNIVGPAVEALGYELVGVEYHRQPGSDLLRIYIDRPEGITVDDCQRASEQVSAALDVEDPIQGHYTLEMSSPGLDRPLFEAEHFERFAGNRVRIRLGMPMEGRRKFTGTLRGIDGRTVVLEVDEQEVRLPLDNIEQARLVPEY